MRVTLSAAKGLARRTQRSFAALRMTGRTPLKPAHRKSYLQMSTRPRGMSLHIRLLAPCTCVQTSHRLGSNWLGFVMMSRREHYPAGILSRSQIDSIIYAGHDEDSSANAHIGECL